jgi:hypothetical protein
MSRGESSRVGLGHGEEDTTEKEENAWLIDGTGDWLWVVTMGLRLRLHVRCYTETHLSSLSFPE